MGEYLDFKIERDELSERLGGGLPRGALVVVEGPYGSGKSIFTQRLLFGLLSNHHKVGVVSTELTTLGFIGQMRSVDYPVESGLLSGDLVFFPVYPLVAERRVPRDLLARLREAERLYSQEVVVIDTFSKLMADQERALRRPAPSVAAHPAGPQTHMHGPPSAAVPSWEARSTMEGGDTQDVLEAEVEETLYHMKRMAAIGKTVILTLEPGRVPEHTLTLFRDASDVHIQLDFSLVGNTAARRIVVNRFSRAKNRFGDVVGYRVEPGVGLVIEIKSVT